MKHRALIEKVERAILSKDWRTYGSLLAPDVRWYTPLFDEPIVGREAMVAMQAVVFDDVFETFDYPDIGYGGKYAYMNFVGTVGDVVLHGTDRVVVNEVGLLSEFHVDARTLSAMQIFGIEVEKALRAKNLLPLP
jgi:hypothetical protein